MEKTIKLKIRKELDSQQQLKVIKLKGSLISSGFTEIIHILDHDSEYHLNTFETAFEVKNEVSEFIKDFIAKENLVDTITFSS